MADHRLPPGYLELIARRYDLKVLNHHYILVDDKFKRYHIMLDLQLNEKMMAKYHELFKGETEIDGVEVEERPSTNSLRFFAEVGNNIILLLDKLDEN